MIENKFIPLYIPYLHEYLLNNFNVNIYNISINDWNKLICNDYCKNITNNMYCFKKYKKINGDNVEFCSKCCKKKGIQREKVYKTRKHRKKEINNDSAFESDSYNDKIRNNITSSKTIDKKIYIQKNFQLNNEELLINNNLKSNKIIEDIKFKNIKKRIIIKIKCLINLKKLYEKSKNTINTIKENNKNNFQTKVINENQYVNLIKNNEEKFKINLKRNNEYNNYIMFGDLEFKIEKKYFNINNNCNNLKIGNFNKVMTNNFIQNESSNFNMNKYKDENRKGNYLLNNNINEKKVEKEDLINYNNDMNKDTYYIFLYIIDLIFKTRNINYIRKELYNCLGVFNIKFYRSQLKLYKNSIL